jgi:hypothetical protein
MKSTFYLVIGLLLGLYHKRFAPLPVQQDYNWTVSRRAGQDFKRNGSGLTLLERLQLWVR